MTGVAPWATRTLEPSYFSVASAKLLYDLVSLPSDPNSLSQSWFSAGWMLRSRGKWCIVDKTLTFTTRALCYNQLLWADPVIGGMKFTCQKENVMKRLHPFVFFQTVAIGWFLLLNGCTPTQDPAVVEPESSAHHGHHDHGVGGPHGGHLVELGDEEFHAEWVHENEIGKVAVFILDETAHEDVAVDAKEVTITVTVGGVPQQYVLEPTNMSNGLASHYEIISSELVVALQVGAGVEATLNIDIGGSSFSASMEDHGHHHH